MIQNDKMFNKNLDFSNLREKIEMFYNKINNPKLKKMFVNCFFNTLDTTVEFMDDGSVYIITGDIDAMWLRDSSAQVMQYMDYVSEIPSVKSLIKGLIKRQMYYINCDPYANAFNREHNNRGFKDECKQNAIVWERKFELDSLCYPIFLSINYYNRTLDKSIFDDNFNKAVATILEVFKTEQKHSELSDYYHYRPDEDDSLSVPNRGRGGDCGYTGMIWSGYRASDDPQIYGYSIPENMFVSLTLENIKKIYTDIVENADYVSLADSLKADVDKGLNDYGRVIHPVYGEIYAYETDGMGNYNLMDDANVPSLLSLPYINYCDINDKVYLNTRKFILSYDNPYYYEGKIISGVGSPHTPSGYVWPLSVIMRALTSDDYEEINAAVDTLLSSDNNTCFIHEGIHKDNGGEYTRDWFAWANSLFSYMILKKQDKIKYINL